MNPHAPALQARSTLRRYDPDLFAAFCYMPRERRRLARFHAGRGRRNSQRVSLNRPDALGRAFSRAALERAIMLSPVPHGMAFTIDESPGRVTITVPDRMCAAIVSVVLGRFEIPGVVMLVKWTETVIDA